MGWASGMRAGIDIGRAYNEAVERKRLEGIRTAAPETSQGYTEEQGQQLEAMTKAINPETGRPYYDVQAAPGGSYTVTPDFTEAQTPMTGVGVGTPRGVASVELQSTGLGRAGVAAQPIPFNQQRVTDFLGRRFEGELTPDRIEALRSRAMAEGLSDPRQRQAALAEATRMEREAELAPLQKKQLEGQIANQAQRRELTGLQLESAKRTDAEQKNATNFSNFAAENPNLSVAELKAAAFSQFKFTPKQWQDTVTTRLGIEKAEMDSFKNSVKKKLDGKNLTQLGSLYNSDTDFDDKTDLAIVHGKNGAVTLNFIDKATNTTVSTQTFKNEALATEFLHKQATEPETIGTWMLNMRKAEEEAAKNQAIANRYNAEAAAGKSSFGPMQVGYEVGPDGQPKMVGLTPVRDVRTGTVTMQRTELGTSGNFIPSEELSDAKLRPLAEQMVKNREMQPSLKDGKKQPHTIETALAQLRQERMARAASAKTGGPGAMSAAAAAIKAADKKTAPPPAPPARGLFTGSRGETQLLQPLFDVNDWRRRMAEDTTDFENQYNSPTGP